VDRLPVRRINGGIQSQETQRRLIAACGATEVSDIDCDHSAARSRPRGLAEVLDGVAALYDDPHASLG